MDKKKVLLLFFGLLFLLLILDFYYFQTILSAPIFWFFVAIKTIVSVAILILSLNILNLYNRGRNINEEQQQAINRLTEQERIHLMELDKSEERRNFLADSLPQIVWECNPEGEVTYFNKRWYSYTGFDVQESLGNNWLKVLHKEDREKTKRIWKDAINSGNPYEIEYRLRDKTGEFNWFLGRALPMFNKSGQIVKWIGTSTNIEDQKNYHTVLEDRINERTLQLQELNEDLIRSNKELENFAYIASHDLQEPLRKIRAFGDILLKKYTENIPEQAKEYMSRMQKASYRMQTLIDDLLNYSRVSRNPVVTDLVDLNDVLNEVVDDLEEIIEYKEAVVKFPELPKIMGDRRQLKQLFQNLISNGIKFHKSEEKPVVEIISNIIETENDNEKVMELTFADNGIGFDEKYHDKIFTIFQRLHGKIEYEGTGIGLAICKKIVENHNGSIYAKSEVGVGSKFVVGLPFYQDTIVNGQNKQE